MIIIIIIIILTIYFYYKNREEIKINGYPKLSKHGKIKYTYIENGIKPVIVYEYKLSEGDKYVNNSIIYNNKITNLDRQKILDDDKIYGGIDIIYNPKNVKETYLLYPKYNDKYIIYIGITLFILNLFI